MPGKVNKRKNTKTRSAVGAPFNVTKNSPDGLALEGMPSLRATPAQPLYRYDLMVEQWKRYAMSVGVSPIRDYISFNLMQIPGIQNFLNIYDFYRIKKVVCLFKCIGTQVYWGNSSGDVPRLSVAIDYNDGTSTGAPAQSYQNCIVTTMTGNLIRSFSPRTAVQLYNGSLSTAYIEGKPSQWIDTNYPSVPHYGLVIDVGATSIDNQFVIALDVLFCLEFKDPRFFASLATSEPDLSNVDRRSERVVGRLVPPTNCNSCGSKRPTSRSASPERLNVSRPPSRGPPDPKAEKPLDLDYNIT